MGRGGGEGVGDGGRFSGDLREPQRWLVSRRMVRLMSFSSFFFFGNGTEKNIKGGRVGM